MDIIRHEGLLLKVEYKLYIGTLDAVKIRKNRQSPSLLPKAASYQIVKDL